MHMGPESGIRLAKAMWWMLARIAGWDGGEDSTPVDPEEPITPITPVS